MKGKRKSNEVKKEGEIVGDGREVDEEEEKEGEEGEG